MSNYSVKILHSLSTQKCKIVLATVIKLLLASEDLTGPCWLLGSRAWPAAQRGRRPEAAGLTAGQSHAVLCPYDFGLPPLGTCVTRASQRGPGGLRQQLCGCSLIRLMGAAGVGPSGLEASLDRPAGPYRAPALLSLRQEGVGC